MSSGSFEEDQFDFDNEETREASKLALLEEIKAHSLDIVVRKVVPIDIMAIFEMNSSEETIDRSADLRQEVLSFIEIAYDS